MTLQCPIPKILLPIDSSEHSRRAIRFAGCLGAALGHSLTGITLLHVMAGGYISRHLSYVDFRAEEIIRSEAIKNIRQQYIQEQVMPFMDEGEKILRDSGVICEIEKLVLDGDPASEILRIVNERGFSTIIMGRRELSEIKGFLLGSITSKVVHSATKQSVYITGQKIPCPAFKILIPVDGSTHSLKGVKHAACLAGYFKNSITRITLLRVINIALYEQRLKEGIKPEEEAKKILTAAKGLLLGSGISEDIILTKVRTGRPAEEIQKEAEEGEYNLIIMGRKGRSALKDLLIGGVSSTVLERCHDQTIAIVSSE